VQDEITAQWVDYKQAQTLTSLGRTTLWRLVSSGEIEAARVGRAVRINRASLTAYMMRSAGRTAGDPPRDVQRSRRPSREGPARDGSSRSKRRR
jgi:excisionase family DNA binding protein